MRGKAYNDTAKIILKFLNIEIEIIEIVTNINMVTNAGMS